MNQILNSRFIKTIRLGWPGIAVALFAAIFSVSELAAQNQFPANPSTKYSGSWTSPEIPSTIPTSASGNPPDPAIQQAGGNVAIDQSWPDQPVTFESRIAQTNHGNQAEPTSDRFESTLESANIAVAGIKQKAADLMGGLGGKASELNITKMFSSLAIVLGAYFGFVWLVRRFHPGSNAQLPAEVVQVLGHTPFGPKQNLQLVRLGHKLLLLLNGPEGSHPIGEITDATEVDYLASLCTSKTNRRTITPRPSASTRSNIANLAGSRTTAPNHPSLSGSNASAQSSPDGKGLADILRSLENVVKQNGGNVFEA